MVITHNVERFNKQTMSDTIQAEWVHMNCVQYPAEMMAWSLAYTKMVLDQTLDTSLYEAEWKRWCYGQTCLWVWLFSPGFRQYATFHCSAKSITDFLQLLLTGKKNVQHVYLTIIIPIISPILTVKIKEENHFD